MMRRHMPRPWDAPGYTFSIGWPAGYEVPGVSPHDSTDRAFAVASAAGQKGGGSTSSTQITEAMRAGELQAIPIGRGNLGVLSPRTVTEIGRNDSIRRGGL